MSYPKKEVVSGYGVISFIEMTPEEYKQNGELVYKWELSIEEEIEMECRERGIEVSTERWEVFENPGITIYALSVAWIEEEELHHFVTTLEVFNEKVC